MKNQKIVTNPLYRIAVCLSGELRTYKVVLPNIKSYFESIVPNFTDNTEIVIDYFIHTWNHNTWKSHETPGKNPKWQTPEPVEFEIDLIRRYLNVIEYRVDNHLTGVDLGVWKPLFYSMYYSNYLKRKHEIENGFEYDMVFKHRLDIALNPVFKFHLHPIENYIVYSGAHVGRMPHELNCYNFDDVIFYGTSLTMDLMSNISRYLIEKTSTPQLSWKNYNGNMSPLLLMGPGGLLYHYMMKMGFNPARPQIIEYIVVRKPVLELGLSTITEFEKVRYYHLNF